MSTKAIDYTIHHLHEGTVDIVKMVAVRTNGTTVTLLQSANGAVFTTQRSSIHLEQDWAANDTLRRAWCKLTGHSFKDLQAYRKRCNEARAVRDKQVELQRLTRLASKLGYKLVKVKVKPVA